jgi:AcrR family transcriptional regulator
MGKTVRTNEHRGYRPGRPNACDSAARIETLLNIATQVFIERGYKGTSLDEIADRAGASKRTLYTRFPSKSDLFQAVMKRETDHTTSHFHGMLPLDKPIRPTMEKFGRELIRTILSPRSLMLMRTLIATVNSFPELAGSFWNMACCRGTMPMSEYLKAQCERGLLVVDDPELAGHIFHGLILGPFLMPAQLGVVPKDRIRNQKEFVAECVRCFLSYYGADKRAVVKQKRRS